MHFFVCPSFYGQARALTGRIGDSVLRPGLKREGADEVGRDTPDNDSGGKGENWPEIVGLHGGRLDASSATLVNRHRCIATPKVSVSAIFEFLP